MDNADLDRRFGWNPPSGDREDRCRQIHAAAAEYARLLNRLCPDSRDKDLAVDFLQDCVARAVLAVSRGDIGTEAASDTPGAGDVDLADLFGTAGPAPGAMADDILGWLREHPWDGDHVAIEPLAIHQKPDGTVRIVNAPDDVAIDVALLRHRGLVGVAFADGVLAIEAEAGPVRYLPLYATDFGFTIAFRRESPSPHAPNETRAAVLAGHDR